MTKLRLANRSLSALQLQTATACGGALGKDAPGKDAPGKDALGKDALGKAAP